MEFQYKGDAAADIDLENEYEFEFKIESLSLKQHQPSDIVLILIFGDFVHKLSCEKDGSFEDIVLNFTVHSVPSELSQKLSKMPIVLYSATKEPDLKPLGSLFVEVNECFANAIKCADFRSESIRKAYELVEGRIVYGTVKFIFSIVKNIGNSNRHRRFYTEATHQRTTMEQKAKMEQNAVNDQEPAVDQETAIEQKPAMEQPTVTFDDFENKNL